MEDASSKIGLNSSARVWLDAGGGLLPVSGRSMRPTFEDRASVWIEQGARPRFGDVLVHSNGEFLIVHRVVAVHAGPLYRTKGDGLAYLDPRLVPAGEVLGRVVAVERRGLRYRIDGSGGRVYAKLAAALSATEGFFYRFAYRIDRALGALFEGYEGAGGPRLCRAVVDILGRFKFALLDAFFFRLMNRGE
jgi:hypothetical protein